MEKDKDILDELGLGGVVSGPMEAFVLGEDAPQKRAGSAARASTQADSTWWTHTEVRNHLRVDVRTLFERMRDTPSHIKRPWVNIGSAKKPTYRWRSAVVDNWWIEVNEWRASTIGATATGSVGATPTVRRGRGSAQTSRRPGGSSAKSSRSSPKDDAGSLVTLVRSLTSARS
ncbi:MAG: hypothetical protein AMXMBFR58_36760 [Phycisphaerae bacterium]